jgi:hypothetical protein
MMLAGQQTLRLDVTFFFSRKTQGLEYVIANLSGILPELVSFHKNRGWILTINTNRRDENEQQGFEHAKCYKKNN